MTLPLSLAEEARARTRRKRADESTVSGNIEVPLRFINRMERKGLIGQKQAENRDWQAITEVLLSSTEKRLFGTVNGTRFTG
jgi:hypothetical protein